MHPVITMKHWSHHLHDSMLTLKQHVTEHLHSRHFWAGVMITLLILGFLTMLYILARNAPFIYPQEYPFIPYGV